MFRELDGDEALVVENGIFKPCGLYEHDGYLFAKIGGGFVKIYDNGSTSKLMGNKNPQQIAGIHLSDATHVYRDFHGRLMVEPRNGNTMISAPAAKLLGLPPPEDTP